MEKNTDKDKHLTYPEGTRLQGRCIHPNSNPQCNIPKDIRECLGCADSFHHNTIKTKPSHLLFEDLVRMGPRDHWAYIYHHKLWRIYPDYIPADDNIYSTGRTSLKHNNFNDLTMGHIYHLFHSLYEHSRENQKNKLIAEGKTPEEIAAILEELDSRRYKDNKKYKEDGSLNERKDMIEETLRHNMAQPKTFSLHYKKLENDLFGKHFTDEKVKEFQQKYELIMATDECVYLVSPFESLLDQLEAIIYHKIRWPSTLPDTDEYRELLLKYYYEVADIKGLIETEYDLGKYNTKRSLDAVKNNFVRCLQKKGITLQEGDTLYADQKKVERGLQKVLAKSKGDPRKLTDVTRGTIFCRSVKDQAEKIESYLDAIEIYNENVTHDEDKITDVSVISKMGDVTGPSPLSSGYRDAKLQIKFANGTVTEMMFQLDTLFMGKKVGYNEIRGVRMSEMIEYLGFSEEDKKDINKVILNHNIIPSQYDFFDLPDDFKVSGDMLYHIYRSLPAYDPQDVHSHSSIESVKKLKYLEREIHEYSRSHNGKQIMQSLQDRKHKKRDDGLRKRLGDN